MIAPGGGAGTGGEEKATWRPTGHSVGRGRAWARSLPGRECSPPGRRLNRRLSEPFRTSLRSCPRKESPLPLTARYNTLPTARPSRIGVTVRVPSLSPVGVLNSASVFSNMSGTAPRISRSVSATPPPRSRPAARFCRTRAVTGCTESFVATRGSSPPGPTSPRSPWTRPALMRPCSPSMSSPVLAVGAGCGSSPLWKTRSSCGPAGPRWWRAPTRGAWPGPTRPRRHRVAHRSAARVK